MTDQEIKSMVEQKTYREARETIQGMEQHELQMVFYWGHRLQKFIFSSAATTLLKEHYGVTPNYELCTNRMSEYT